ncbi:class I SAM-dependent methyltransferase [Paenibacillus qinlingensis]|uniref:tRNA (Cmo5U34)-methyltransferase n=1 Tax=Paenibacillus qinlingensis TaxID=1837343 RepID=A0ABU1NSN6_9BACL|nr:class I SAM-dependent methyltransferase [Paenibacillus qinlingensis]MDR6549892.1 tRNA (cmo5U34)-methyltransferase [Paenibacillus qinlingensis]
MNNENTHNANRSHMYDTKARISIPSYDALFAMIQSYFRVQLDGGDASLLVIGAGGGNELTAWGPANPAWSFTGIDISEEMLKIAQYKANQLRLENRVNLIHGTIDELPATDEKFDAASCILVLHFIPDVQEKLKLLRTINAHLKPGAPFVLVSAFGDRDSKELQNRLHIWKSFWLDAGDEASSVDEMVNKALMSLSFLSDEHIEKLLTEAGFTNITRFYTTGLFGGWMSTAAL